MPSSYTPSLKLILQATGENNGTWGTLNNTDFTSLVDIAIAGYESISMTDADRTLTNGNGSLANESRYAFINMTGTLTAARNVIVPAASKIYFFKNATTGGFALTLKTASGTGISILNGSAMVLMCDGTNVIDAVTAFSSLKAAALTVTGTTTLGAVTLGGTVSGGGNQINNVVIGTSTPLAGAFTTLSATGTISNTGTSLSGSAAAGSLILDASGNVGVGLTPIASGGLLQTTTALGFSASAWAVGYSLASQTTTIVGVANTPYYGINMGTFTGFSGQGLGIHGSGGLLFTTSSGTERMRIDYSGNVGIGTATPGAKLAIGAGNTLLDNGYGYAVKTTGGTSNTILDFDTTNSIRIGPGSATVNVQTYTGGTERMRVDSSGNVSIGATTAIGNERLLVMKQTPSDGVVAYFKNGPAATTTGALVAFEQGGIAAWRAGLVPNTDAFAIYGYGSGTYPERMRINSSGNVGIGTATPVVKLDVNGGLRGNAFDAINTPVLFSSAGGTVLFYNGTGEGGIRAYSNASGAAGTLIFSATGSENMRIDGSGNVGIGTASPTFKLDVSGGQARIVTPNGTTSYLRITQTGQRDWQLQIPASSTDFTIYDASASAERMRIDTSGNLIQSAPTTPPTLANNGQMVFNLTSNTNLRVSVRGFDGVTRVANLTLA